MRQRIRSIGHDSFARPGVNGAGILGKAGSCFSRSAGVVETLACSTSAPTAAALAVCQVVAAGERGSGGVGGGGPLRAQVLLSMGAAWTDANPAGAAHDIPFAPNVTRLVRFLKGVP